MRSFRPWVVASIALASSFALVLAACGSSNSEGGGGGSGDGGNGGGGDATVSDGGGSPGQDGASTDGTTADVDAGILGDNCPAVDAAGFVTANHGPLPTMAYFDGGILTAPRLVTFTFEDTFEPAQLATFGATVTQTPWFAEVTKDYCINDGGTCIQGGSTGVAIAMDASAGTQTFVDNNFNPPGSGLSDAGPDLSTLILDQIEAATKLGVLSGPNANDVYTFYFPAAATVSMGDPNLGGSLSCGFGGYHGAFGALPDGGGVPITYSVVVDCAPPSTGASASDELAQITISSSHELIEATTDPYNGTGWYLDQDFGPGNPTPAQVRNDPWANAYQFGELGDNCESLLDPSWTLDGGLVVQRIWSTSAAAKGQNPCVPVPAGETYYGASPDKVLYVADVGSTFSVTLTPFSDVPRSSWRLDARQGTANQNPDGGNPPDYLGFDFVGGVDGGPYGPDDLCANNGAPRQLNVTLLADPAQDPSLTNAETWPEADAIIYSADVDEWSGPPNAQVFPVQAWPFAVVTPAIAASIGLTDAGVADDHVRLLMAGSGSPVRQPRHSHPARALGRPLPHPYVVK